MKLLILSDSHRSVGGMLDAVEKERPDRILHLGDYRSDTEELGFLYPSIPILSVPGNCDGWTGEPEERRFHLAGHCVLMGHGHRWYVKHDLSAALLAARKAGAELLLFGHTHVPLCRQEEDGLWVMNPGSIRDRDSYGLIFLEPGLPPECRLATL